MSSHRPEARRRRIAVSFVAYVLQVFAPAAATFQSHARFWKCSFLSTPQGRPQMRPVTCKITLASALQMCDMPSDSLSQASEWPRLFAISSNDSSEILQHDSIFKRDESNESSSQRPGKARGEAIRQADRSTTGQHHSFPARHCSCA